MWKRKEGWCPWTKEVGGGGAGDFHSSCGVLTATTLLHSFNPPESNHRPGLSTTLWYISGPDSESRVYVAPDNLGRFFSERSFPTHSNPSKHGRP